MTDVDLIEALRTCSEYPGCESCPLCGVIECTTVAADRLESAIVYGNDMYQEVQLQICKREQYFAAGAMAMQEAVLDILNRMSVRNKGIVRSALRDAMAAVNNLEVEHE